jgi:hypothetical protein
MAMCNRPATKRIEHSDNRIIDPYHKRKNRNANRDERRRMAHDVFVLVPAVSRQG